MAKSKEHLEYSERELVTKFRFEDKSISVITEFPGRVKSAISDEINQNSRDGKHNPRVVEGLTACHRSRSGAPVKMKYPKFRDCVERGLKNQWSPEQSSGRI